MDEFMLSVSVICLFFKQKTAYELRISDWSSDVCSSDLPTQLLEAVDCSQAKNTPNFGEAIVAPVHLPRGLVGAVFWCSREPVGVETIFAAQAGDLHNLAVKLVATHNEARGRPRNATVPQKLTRREVQCLRWAAASKTDGEIGILLALSRSEERTAELRSL